MPNPAFFPKHEWRVEVAQGYRFYESTENLKLDVPPREETVTYFESRAPESLTLPDHSHFQQDSQFRVVNQDPGHADAVAVSSLQFDTQSGTLWATDMKTGALLSAQPGGQFSEATRSPLILNPCRAKPTNFDGNGANKLLLSDLGTFLPLDHQNGAVWLVDPGADWNVTQLLSNVSRVCDTQTGDLDQDGDLDIVVAEFGWRRTGRVNILWNEADDGKLAWRIEQLDDRHGAIDVPIIDINGDGLLDIVVLFSQEHESVECYLNNGNGSFEKSQLYDAGDPSFGSSGMEIVDFDRDGDFDIIHCNGDSFDSSDAKPFHGIRWLENDGRLSFIPHEIAAFAGVHRAVAGDLDQDGDLDIAAVALLPPSVAMSSPSLPSIIWAEQRSDRRFQIHVIETGQPNHASCALVDWDKDGDLDLFASNFNWDESRSPAVTQFENQPSP